MHFNAKCLKICREKYVEKNIQHNNYSSLNTFCRILLAMVRHMMKNDQTVITHYPSFTAIFDHQLFSSKRHNACSKEFHFSFLLQ